MPVTFTSNRNPPGIVIRYRIDGILHTQPMPPEINHFQAAIISRLKIMARLNIAEKRLPQDGRIKLKVHGREVDVRVSVIPMIHGEGLVMRILDKGSMVFDLQKLGMIRKPMTIVQQTDSIATRNRAGDRTNRFGKDDDAVQCSACEINSPETKIITTEDPVEYQLEGINQIQVHPKIGLTFAHSLRSILASRPGRRAGRRDSRPGNGRKCHSGVVDRPPGVQHVAHQRRGRRLHANGRHGSRTVPGGQHGRSGHGPATGPAAVPAMPGRIYREPDDLPDDFPWDPLDGRPLYRAAGCRECRDVGYRGRMGIYELLVTTERIRELAHARATTWEMKKAALSEGMRTLRDDGWLRAMSGDTSVEEIMRVTKSDRIGG